MEKEERRRRPRQAPNPLKTMVLTGPMFPCPLPRFTLSLAQRWTIIPMSTTKEGMSTNYAVQSWSSTVMWTWACLSLLLHMPLLLATAEVENLVACLLERTRRCLPVWATPHIAIMHIVITGFSSVFSAANYCTTVHLQKSEGSMCV